MKDHAVIALSLVLLLSAGCGGEYDDQPYCGDGILEGFEEECDYLQLDGHTCEDFGFTGGELACDEQCRFDTSACEPACVCGDGIVCGAEECDLADLDGATCETFGRVGGTLACTANCIPSSNEPPSARAISTNVSSRLISFSETGRRNAFPANCVNDSRATSRTSVEFG